MLAPLRDENLRIILARVLLIGDLFQPLGADPRIHRPVNHLLFPRCPMPVFLTRSHMNHIAGSYLGKGLTMFLNPSLPLLHQKQLHSFVGVPIGPTPGPELDAVHSRIRTPIHHQAHCHLAGKIIGIGRLIGYLSVLKPTDWRVPSKSPIPPRDPEPGSPVADRAKNHTSTTRKPAAPQ